MNLKLKNKISEYSAVAGGVLLTSVSASASVIYTDISPDVVVNANGSYNLDLNNDLINDFTITASSSSYISTSYSSFRKYVSVRGVGSNEVMYVPGASWSGYADALNNGANISNAASWYSWNLKLAKSSYSSWSGTQVGGPWLGQSDKYLGLKFEIGSNTHYGWARLDVGATPTTFTIKDYAYEAAAGISIVAGDVGGPPVDSANTLTLSDVSDNYDPSDFSMSFNKAADETKVSEYRIVLVPIANVAGFTYTNALTASVGSYQTVVPNGANFSGILNSSLKDYRGFNIVLDDQYQAFVLSVPVAGFSYNLSLASNSMSISSPPPTPSAQNVVISDISDNGDGSDMQLDFVKAADETTIASYKVILVPKSGVSFFSISVAEATPSSWSESFAPNGSNFTFNFNSASRDFQGSLIVENKPYFAYVLSVNNNGINPNSLAVPSNELTLIDSENPPKGINELNNNFELFTVNKGFRINNINSIANAKVNVYSSEGKLIVSKNLTNNQEDISLSDYSGVAIISIVSENEQIYTNKLLIK